MEYAKWRLNGSHMQAGAAVRLRYLGYMGRVADLRRAQASSVAAPPLYTFSATVQPSCILLKMGHPLQSQTTT
jgi:hypothetical protein